MRTIGQVVEMGGKGKSRGFLTDKPIGLRTGSRELDDVPPGAVKPPPHAEPVGPQESILAIAQKAEGLLGNLLRVGQPATNVGQPRGAQNQRAHPDFAIRRLLRQAEAEFSMVKDARVIALEVRNQTQGVLQQGSASRARVGRYRPMGPVQEILGLSDLTRSEEHT